MASEIYCYKIYRMEDNGEYFNNFAVQLKAETAITVGSSLISTTVWNFWMVCKRTLILGQHQG